MASFATAHYKTYGHLAWYAFVTCKYKKILNYFIKQAFILSHNDFLENNHKLPDVYYPWSPLVNVILICDLPLVQC